MFKKVHGGKLRAPMYVRAGVKSLQWKRKPAASRPFAASSTDLKYIDTFFDPALAGTALQLINGGDQKPLNGITVGTSPVGQHVGAKVMMKKLVINGVVSALAGATQQQDVSIMLVYSPKGTLAPSFTNTLDANQPTAQYNYDNVPDDLKVLRRWNYALTPYGLGANECYDFHKTVILNKKITFTKGGAVDNGLLYLIAVGQRSGATAAQLTGSARITYSDDK